jgi:uncharacterized protein
MVMSHYPEVLMKLIQEGSPGAYRIRSYAPGRIVINEIEYTRSVLLSPEQLDDGWPPQSPDDIIPDHIRVAMEQAPEVILLGTGERQRFPPREVMQTALRAGVGIEVMDTGSACRTFNILLGEGRRVVAALLP